MDAQNGGPRGPPQERGPPKGLESTSGNSNDGDKDGGKDGGRGGNKDCGGEDIDKCGDKGCVVRTLREGNSDESHWSDTTLVFGPPSP